LFARLSRQTVLRVEDDEVLDKCPQWRGCARAQTGEKPDERNKVRRLVFIYIEKSTQFSTTNKIVDGQF
jgi:hypothetical protein